MSLIEILYLYGLVIILILLLSFMIYFKYFMKSVVWCINTTRDICKEPDGFIKFGQTAFILLSWFCFLVLNED